MWRKLIYSFSLVLLLSIPTYQAKATYPFLQDPGPNGIVSMEAENFDDNVPQGFHTWTLKTQLAGASDSNAMQALPNDKTTKNNIYCLTESPYLDFQVSFVKTGTYYVWVRGNASGNTDLSGSDDSCHTGLDNQVNATYIDFDRPTTWGWFKGRTNGNRATFEVLNTGVHTVNIWMRESGAIIDKIVLTIDANYVPSGEGPAESSRTNPLFVDDFENYSATNEIFETWVGGNSNPGNGTGSIIPYVEQTIVHSGGKSMPYYYDNNRAGKAHYSEADRTFAAPQDWTKEGVKALTLYFYGNLNNAVNATERMYVALKDDSNKMAVVYYDGDANDVRDPNWHEWNIRLKDFTDINSVNLSNVKKVYIGFGDRNHPTAGGSGLVYFDDIRLYPTRCVPSRVKGNFNDDCVVDYEDLEIMTENWLNVVPLRYTFIDFASLADNWLEEVLWP